MWGGGWGERYYDGMLWRMGGWAGGIGRICSVPNGIVRFRGSTASAPSHAHVCAHPLLQVNFSALSRVCFARRRFRPFWAFWRPLWLSLSSTAPLRGKKNTPSLRTRTFRANSQFDFAPRVLFERSLFPAGISQRKIPPIYPP